MSDLAQRMASLSPAQRKLLEQRLAGKKPTAEPIAIVGMSCRFAGAQSLADYWRVIDQGVEAVSEVPPDRWDIEELYDPTGTQSGKMFTKWGGFVDGIDQFDPQFFGIAPREAARMDPQQRMLLEVAWEAMENGGISADSLAGSKTGVYVGIGGADYSKVPSQFADYYHHIDAHVGTGNALSIAANRISYIFDLHGPSAAVDTACSSASLAIHLAVESLRRKECDAAIAGGVNAIITPETTIAFSKARMLSPEGKCRPFDAGANGYVRGEGCGLVLLKRLADAQRDGDQVLAVIRATSVNQDGRTSGISAPNGQSQQECIRAAHAQAGITPDDISYIEAHGTGTPLGDPIEMQALTEIFKSRGDSDRPVHVTSVKANIGHTETVSGAAGLIKAVLLMQHERIPPQLYLESINPHITLEGSRIKVPTEHKPWPETMGRRLAGISSFGFGGTNTHIVIEAPPASHEGSDAGSTADIERIGVAESDRSERTRHVLKLSGRNAASLEQQAANLAAYMNERPEVELDDLCYSANTGRSDFNYRAAVACDSRESLGKALTTLAAGKASPTVKRGQIKGITRPKIAMLFTGQGSQYPQMGLELYQTEPLFREIIDQCDEILRTGLSESLLTVLFPENDRDAELVNQTVFTQPALFAIEYAVARLWQSWGVEPNILLGHSVGEYVAATVAGCMNLNEGLGLISERARLMQQISKPGKMAVVFAPEADVAARLAGKEHLVTIAAVNGPENTVISGDAETVDQLVAEFESSGIGLQRLVVSHAFHSPLMDEMLDDFEEFADGIDFKPPRITVISNLTGQAMSQAPTARYWRDHVRGAVRFVDGVQRVGESKASILLEVGPAASLLGMAKRCLPNLEAASVASLRKGQAADQTIAAAVGDLYTAGAKIDWRARDQRQTPKRLLLPNYPFHRERFWFDMDNSATGGAARRRAAGGHPLLGGRVPTVWTNSVYETVVDANTPGYLIDHQVQGSVVVPGAAFIEQGLAATKLTFDEGQHAIRDVSIQAAMFLPSEGSRLVQVTVEPEAGGRSEMESYSSPADADPADWNLHATCTLLHESQLPALDSLPVIDLEEVRSRIIDPKTREEYYEILAARGLVYGPQFQVLGDVARTDCEAIATLQPHEAVVAELAKYQLHPVLGDACWQTLASTVPLEENGEYSPYTYMPVGVGQVRVVRPIESFEKPVYCYAVRRSDDDRPSPDSVTSDVYLVDADGQVLVEMLAAKVQRIGRGAAGEEAHGPADWLYQMTWKSAPLESTAEPAAGTWLVFGDSAGVHSELVKRLTSDNRKVALVWPGEEFKLDNLSAGSVQATIDPLNESHYADLISQITSKEHPLVGVVHLWSLDIPAPEPGDATQMWAESSRLGVASAMFTIKQLARCGQAKMPRLWLATNGAQAVTEGEPTMVAEAPLVGLVRVAAVEHTELTPTLVDLDAKQLDPANLLAELGGDSTDSQVAYRNGQRMVARLVEDEASRQAVVAEEAAAGTVPSGSAFQLRITNPGSFDALKYVAIERQPPGPGEVEFAVHATGLNFSDVLKALGLYPGIKDEIVPLGIEASGVVTAVGEGVDRFQVGDEVMGVAPYAFASHATTRDYTLVHKPKNISHDEASTVPIVFLTAFYGLVRLAEIQPGDRVLIHAGAGGVGLAAIQICQDVGAEVFVTAGSDEKREFLRSLGVKHIYNSRTLDFAEEILADTDREGVDVVLNSLPGEAITKSLSILRAYGRFLEIGKIDIYQNRKIGLLPFQDNLSYHAIDLDRMLRQRPNYIRGLYHEMMPYFEAGKYQPELFTRFELDGTIDAFRYMSQRKNIGKVVVAIADSVSEAAEPAATRKQTVRSDGTYLITGGLGGLGLLVADWLAEQGAGGLVLMSRRAASESGRKAIAALEAKGAKVFAMQADVVDYAALEQGFKSLPGELPPLRGVIHAAGVLADGVLADMSLEQLNRAMLSKTVGAWNLHSLTAEMPLDLFVLFSSVAAMIGSPGQANYAAGNATLDALAHYRRSQGLPATSINWGPWAGSGMAAETFADTDRETGIQSRGMDLLPADAGLKLMGDLIDAGTTQTTVMDVYWEALLRLLGTRRLSLLDDRAAEHGDGEGGGSSVDHEFRDRLLEAEPVARVPLVRDYIQAELARIMSFDPDQLDVDQPLTAFGLDSLMALELKNNLEARLAFTLPMAKLLEGPSIASLAADTVGLITGEEAPSTEDSVAEGWSPLVKLREGTLDEPLVLLPALGGDVGCYQQLVQHLSGDRPIVAFRPRGMDDPNPPHNEMHHLAADYAAALCELQPTGPYYLAGWSAGGVSAFAMAEALMKGGHEVKLLALFDTPLPTIYRDIDVDDDALFLCDLVRFTNRFAGTNIEVSVDKLAELPKEKRFAAALEQARDQGMFPPSVSDEYVHRLINVGSGLIRASQGYQPQPIDLEMHLFQPAVGGGLEDISDQQLPEDNGWNSLVGQRIERTSIPGDHFTMMTGEGAERLAAILDKLMS
ncbi:SDR family NAD(P)-dependent oxidoreductase [Aeoliella sp. ICT_H6.2]|uniref:SDR family NAD(P)-dependent oxidoreductase n=1 Tax=Aeoliella straminimaris TaxID=2954799 RepID=A0A9X2F5L2_9BACT|nr:type I polyketide synthase [Aeoliella straminimaris]MCO6042585.1 SDR family NAD(P)-dependent oxidoreductase [Aeoliella straminimaris]